MNSPKIQNWEDGILLNKISFLPLCIKTKEMDKSREILLNDLTKKIELLISRYEQIRAERNDLSLKLAACKSELEISNNKIKELEQKIDNLQLIEAFKASAGDVKEAKHNISKLVREIDKCIALLND